VVEGGWDPCDARPRGLKILVSDQLMASPDCLFVSSRQPTDAPYFALVEGEPVRLDTRFCSGSL